MNVTRLLQRGYFPKELPPPFNTEILASKSSFIIKKWADVLNTKALPIGGETNSAAKERFYQDYIFKYGSSSDMSFSLAKGMLSRRQLSIPNPKQYVDLSKNIVDNWKTLRTILRSNNFSASSPVEAGAHRSVRTKSKSLNEFMFRLIEISSNKKFELRLDINQFYPSIYTHSIAWAVLGKETALKYFKLKNKNKNKADWNNLIQTDNQAKLYVFCDQLDTLVRNCQDRQSVGFPIGPDTSFILAEIVGSRIDKEICEKFRNLDYSFIRYYDDYYFYTQNYGDAEKILKETQGILNRYNLEINESKVNIKQLPFTFQPPWVSRLSEFHFKSVNRHELLGFFTIIFELIDENKKESSWIISHGLGRFVYGNIRIPDGSWDIFLTLLTKTLLTDSSNIDIFLKIILSYEQRLLKKHKEKIGKLLHSVIDANIILNHSFEVSWSLWILRTLKLRCESPLLLKVINSDDHISKLICLDLIFERLYRGRKPSLKSISSNLNSGDFLNEKWLFVYESIKKGWIRVSDSFLSSNEFFKILSDYEVEFYNTRNQIELEFKEEEYRFLPF